MADSTRREWVDSYCEHLAQVWGIVPWACYQDLVGMLTSPDDDHLRRWRERLLRSNDEKLHEQFYLWATQEGRFGPVHSLKWMEIFTSGIWAAAVLKQWVPQGNVLDLGCNAGYWTSWMTARSSRRIVGIEKLEPVVRFGRQRCAEKHLSCAAHVGDFCDLPADRRYRAAVSLQGLTLSFHRRQFEVIPRIGRAIEDEGYLVLVDELPGPSEHYQSAFRNAGFTIVAAGLVGGLGIDAQWKGYTALLLRKDGGSETLSLARAEQAVENLWREFHPFATRADCAWTARNSASWWSHGGAMTVCL